MKTKAIMLLTSMFLTVFSVVAFGAESGKNTYVQNLVKQKLKTLSKTVAATITAQGMVSGRVIDRQSNAGVANITVTAHPQVGDFCSTSGGSALTDSTGNYTITGLASGAYKIEFSEDSDQALYSRQWYNDTLDEGLGTVIQVTEPGTTTGINASLDRGGAISGKVTCPSSAPISSFSVQAVGSKGYVTSTTATILSGTTGIPGYDGSYTLSGLPSDTYTVSFNSIYMGDSSPLCVSQDYPSQVPVDTPSVTANINETLALGGSITGKLVDSSNIPIPNVQLYTTAPGAPLVGTTNFGISDQTGTFTISGLAGGTYDVIIDARQSGTGYILLKQASVSVSPPGTTDIGTKTLQPGGLIKGTVTNKSAGAPLKDVSVIGYDTTGEFVSFAVTDAAGAYTLTGFASGSDKVQFVACQGGYAEQWYNGKASQANADPVTVAAPNATIGINGVLDLGVSNIAPVASSQSVTTAGNSSKSITLAATDAEGDSLTYSIITPPAHGALTGTPPAVTYAPTSGYSGPDSFTFKANDGNKDSNIATVTITVTAAAKPGDCDNNGTVTIAEVQSAINMFLGLNTVAPCVDTNGNNSVSIDEVQKTINSFLGL